jgi:hypothetical protein
MPAAAAAIARRFACPTCSMSAQTVDRPESASRDESASSRLPALSLSRRVSAVPRGVPFQSRRECRFRIPDSGIERANHAWTRHEAEAAGRRTRGYFSSLTYYEYKPNRDGSGNDGGTATASPRPQVKKVWELKCVERASTVGFPAEVFTKLATSVQSGGFVFKTTRYFVRTNRIQPAE